MPQFGANKEGGDHAERMAAMKKGHDEMQLRTFTRWWNSVLAPRGIKIESLLEDVRSGVVPIALFESLSNELVKRCPVDPSPCPCTLPRTRPPVTCRYVANPTTRFHMLENNNNFLGQLKAKGIRLVNIAGAPAPVATAWVAWQGGGRRRRLAH